MEEKDVSVSLENICKQDFVVLEADGKRFCVRKSTLIGAHQPAAYGATPEISFFSMLLNNASRVQSVADVSTSVTATSPIDKSEGLETRETHNTDIVSNTQLLGKRKRCPDDVGLIGSTDDVGLIDSVGLAKAIDLANSERKIQIVDKTSESDSTVLSASTTSRVVAKETSTFRLDLDPDSLSVIVKYLRGYPIFPGNCDSCLRHCVSRDADMLGIIGLVQEIQRFEESLADGACTMSAWEPSFLRRQGDVFAILDKLGLKSKGVEFWLKYMHEEKLRILLPTRYNIAKGHVRSSYDTFTIDCHGLLLRTAWLSVCPTFAKRGLPYVVPVKNNPKFVGWIRRHWKETTASTDGVGITDYTVQHETNAWTVRFYCSSENNLSDEFRQIQHWHATVYDNLASNKLLSSLFSRDRKWHNKMWLCSRGNVKTTKDLTHFTWRALAKEIRFVDQHNRLLPCQSAWEIMSKDTTMCRMFVTPKAVWMCKDEWGVRWTVPLIQICGT